MTPPKSILRDLQLDADVRFSAAFETIRKSTPRRERFKNEAWVTDYAEDTDIALVKRSVEGGIGNIVYEMSSDFTSEMVVSLPPARHGQVFRHYVKGPDEISFRPTSTMSQYEICERFVGLVQRSGVALSM
jgi:hypothetical protein